MILHFLVYVIILIVITSIFRSIYKNGPGGGALWNIDFQERVLLGNVPLEEKEGMMLSIPKGPITSILLIALSLFLLYVTMVNVELHPDYKLGERLIIPVIPALPGGIGIASIITRREFRRRSNFRQ